MQLVALGERKAAAERALAGVAAALAQRVSSETLSLEELCSLVRRTEMTETNQHRLRELINKEITPEEERAWLTWTASQPSRDIESGRRFMEEYRGVFRDLAALARSQADPAGPEAQRLVDRHNELLLQHGIRERAVAAMEWNPQVASKWLALGAQFYADTSAPDPDAARRDGDFILAAIHASPASRAFRELRDRAAVLVDAGEPPSSAAAQALAAEFREAAAQHRFGEPVVLCKWALARGMMRLGTSWVPLGDRERSAYEYLIRALQQQAAAA